MSPYEILEIAVNATDDEIRKAYRKKAMQFHPDRCKDSDATEKFCKVQEAYESLTNQDRRPPSRRTYQAPPKESNNWIRDAPPPTHDLWGNPIGKEQSTYTPPVRPRRFVAKPPEEPPVDVWKGVYGKAIRESQAYWEQYELLKKTMAYEEPEKFWEALDEWNRRRNK
jgi:hypothetical protein